MSSMVLTVSGSDSCANCFASARFHLQNPFGVYYTKDDTLKYYEWHNRPADITMQCPEYMMSYNNHTLDHDTLFRYMSHA